MNILRIFLIGAVLETPAIFGAAGGAFAATGGASAVTGTAAVSVAAPSLSTSTLTLTIYHTNDIHGWIMPRPKPTGTDPSAQIGGTAALAAYVRRQPAPKLFLDSGDWFQGTPEGTLSNGQSLVEIYNALGYDAVEVGNHDFDLGEPRLKEMIRDLKMPVLGANVYDQKTHKRVRYLKPYVIKEVAGVKVGIFGLLTAKMPVLSFAKNIEGLEFRREADEAADMVRELKAKGATVIIAVTHMGFEQPKTAPYEGDKFLAEHVPDIDLIIGGHTHTPLWTPYRDPTNGTLIVQAGSYLTMVGKATLGIDPATKRIVSSSGSLVELRLDRTGEAEDVARITRKYQDKVGKALDVAVGAATETLTRNMRGESSLGDWMTDCTLAWAGTELAFQNGGGIRSDIASGPVTLRELFQVMPFDNYVVKFKMTGRQVRENLEHGVSGAPGVLQVGGLRFQYNPVAPIGRRVLAAWVGDRPLEDHWVYTASTLDFLIKGGDGYTFSEGTDTVNTGTLERDVLAWCARTRSPVRAAPLNRNVQLMEGGSSPESAKQP